MKHITFIVLVTLSMVCVSLGDTLTPCDKALNEYRAQNPSSSMNGVTADVVGVECVLRTGNLGLTQAQINALATAYDARMATKQAAANALYATISTRLGLATPITTKAQLQTRILEVYDALDDKEQQVWTAIEASGMNATRAGQLKQLAQARNRILRLLAEDGIQ